MTAHLYKYRLCVHLFRLSFTEVATGLSVIMSGTLDERLYCAFKAFDEDGNGNLDVHEVTRLLQSSGFSLETAQVKH